MQDKAWWTKHVPQSTLHFENIIQIIGYMELDLIGWDPANFPSPRIWAHIRGRDWSAKIDEISLQPPDPNTKIIILKQNPYL